MRPTLKTTDDPPTVTGEPGKVRTSGPGRTTSRRFAKTADPVNHPVRVEEAVFVTAPHLDSGAVPGDRRTALSANQPAPTFAAILQIGRIFDRFAGFKKDKRKRPIHDRPPIQRRCCRRYSNNFPVLIFGSVFY